jgi:hypothetical protein
MSNFNSNNFIEEEIRLPDNPIREILVNSNINYDINYNNAYGINYNNYNNYENISIIPNDYDPELQLAINESIKEQEEYEKKQLEMLEKTRLRVQTFKDVLFKIKKISMIDSQILKLYNIIEPMIDSYCACNIDIYECDKAMYDEIFSTLKTIRLTESELELFKNLFVMEN